jgi:cytochrome oxidase Cu insertion factor (SCO1/SenC/PrrC family)
MTNATTVKNDFLTSWTTALRDRAEKSSLAKRVRQETKKLQNNLHKFAKTTFDHPRFDTVLNPVGWVRKSTVRNAPKTVKKAGSRR